MVKKTGVMCPNCQEVLFSYSRHDFKECKCGDTFVDGGNDYLRYGGKVRPYLVDMEEDGQLKIDFGVKNDS